MKSLLLMLIVFYVNGIESNDDNYCPEENCAFAGCFPLEQSAGFCMKERKAFIFPDNICNCCGKCLPTKDVINPELLMNCEAGRCSKKCVPQTANDCKADQVLVPSDGVCFCCNECIDRKR